MELQSGAPERLKLLIEGESLVNDGSASVVFFLMQVTRFPFAGICNRKTWLNNVIEHMLFYVILRHELL